MVEIISWPGRRRPPAGAALARLQLEDGPEELLRGGREEADLGVGVKPVEDGRLRREVVGDVAVVALVVHAGRAVEPRRQLKLPVQLVGVDVLL